jgi:tetratricopeptide (TPR) repeat protein
MLFDLRGRGRRRTIKIVYITLALLMGGGLVLFGIGGGGAMQGGLVDAITGSSGGDTGSERFDKAEKDAAAATRRNPQNAAAWATLARARVQSAGIGDNFDPNSAAYTESGKAKLAQAADAWQRYLALEPKNPDDRVAGLMVRAFDQTGLNRPADAAAAQEIITEARPSATTYATLAIYAYQAGQTRKGDLARGEALERAPKDERNTLKSSLDQAKQQAVAQQLQQDRARRRPRRPPRPSSRGGRGRGPWLPLAPAPL